ncbi:hypothetical protein WJS89_11990 [Sphingomicrobium sp. XHP0235]|uniref:hypothetical protein n=1 Tax=Sphingomicrobium aquimarinum TaxID=3133971 RepID=UPI0031FF1086
MDEGKIDLLIGEFGRAGPVSREASLSKAIGVPEPKSPTEPVLRLARKRGENELITVTDRMVME